MSIPENLRTSFTRSQAEFANVIQDLEAELKRMRENERIPQDLVNKKDEQIETLIRFNNRIEDLFNAYKLHNINLQAEMMATQRALWELLKTEQKMTEFLELPKPQNP
jgi:hypothetical protein